MSAHSYSTLADRLFFLLKGPPVRRPVDLARACEVSPASVTGWLGGGGMAQGSLTKAAAFFGVREEWLALGIAPMREIDGGQRHAAIEEPRTPYTIEPRKGAWVYASDHGYVCVRQMGETLAGRQQERALVFHPEEVEELILALKKAKTDAIKARQAMTSNAAGLEGDH